MSKRSERRAVERAAHKAARTQSIAVLQPCASQAAPAGTPADLNFPIPEEDDLQDFTPHQELTASEAQINANRENAQKSTGPATVVGKAVSAQNRRSHGLIGRFIFLTSESPNEYESLVRDVYDEYAPQSPTEFRLAHSLIQHYWLMNRTLLLQEKSMNDDKKLALYMRYQTTHERSYYRAQKELQKLVRERAGAEISFERQKRAEESHDAKVRLAHAKAQSLEIAAACRKVMEAPLPGNAKIGFEQLTRACSTAIAALVMQTEAQTAA